MTKSLYAEFTVKAGSEARVAEMMLELARHVRNEPGNELFLPYTREENTRDSRNHAPRLWSLRCIRRFVSGHIGTACANCC